MPPLADSCGGDQIRGLPRSVWRQRWRLFQASQLNPHARGEEFDLAYLKYEFWFEQLVEVSA